MKRKALLAAGIFSLVAAPAYAAGLDATDRPAAIGEPLSADQGVGFTDQQIEDQLAQAFAASAEINHPVNLTADVTNGVVTLDGLVGREVEKEAAIAIAAATPGIREVNAEMLEVMEEPEQTTPGFTAGEPLPTERAGD